MGTRWRRWLRHCAASLQFAVSIRDGVIGIFDLLNSFGRGMSLGSTQPVTEMSIRDFPWGGGGVKAACAWG